jgi:hypothetical protein
MEIIQIYEGANEPNMKIIHPHRQLRTRLVLASIVVLTTLLLIGARPSIASAASNVRLHPNSGGCGYDTLVAVATSTNVSGDSLYIDDFNTNNNPSAFILITPNWNPNGVGGVYNNHPTGVWYNTAKGRWAIFNEDGAAMPLGAAFNVYTSPSCEGGVTFMATSANTVGDSVNLPLSFVNPITPPIWTLQDLYLVTQNWNPNGVGGVYNNHPIGVWFEGPKGPWAVFNQDESFIPPGASFNVYANNCPPYCYGVRTVVTGTGTLNGDSTIIDDPALNGQPSAQVFVTPNWNPNAGYGVYDNHNVGVWYNAFTARWEIFNADGAAMPAGASFNYAVI